MENGEKIFLAAVDSLKSASGTGKPSAEKSFADSLAEKRRLLEEKRKKSGQ